MTHTITIRPATDERPGWTEVNLAVAGQTQISHCGILSLQMRIGAAVVRMDGIGGVNTLEAYRKQGYSRHVLNAAIAHMSAGDAALTMLYGITDFYPKFGYATAGPDYLMELPVPQETVSFPAGWLVRAFEPDDIDAIHALYEQSTAGTSGAAVRDPSVYPWTRLRATAEEERPNECRVLVDQVGVLRGYAWRGSGCGFVSGYVTGAPDKFILAEVIASDPTAADIILDACTNWARAEAEPRPKPISHIAVVMPPEGIVASAAMLRSSTFKRAYSATGGSMARVLDVERLCRALLPEFRERIKATGLTWTGTLHIVTDIGAASLVIENEGVIVLPVTPATDEGHVVHMPQPALARLAMGTFPPHSVLERLDDPPAAPIQDVIAALFPQRNPHMFLVDRY